MDQEEFKNLYCNLKGWKANNDDANDLLSYAEKPCKFIFQIFDSDKDGNIGSAVLFSKL